MKLYRIFIIMALCVLLAVPICASAGTWKATKPIKLIVPWGAGGSTDRRGGGRSGLPSRRWSRPWRAARASGGSLSDEQPETARIRMIPASTSTLDLI